MREISLIIAGVILFVFGLVAYVRWAERRRSQMIRQTTDQLGLEFRPQGDQRLLQRLASFQIFRQGRSRKMRNMVVGDAGDVNISIFDYQYTVGGGNHQTTIVQTVAALESQQLEVPPFFLRPESLMDRLGGAMGLQKDIDLEGFPEFSRMFLLKSPEESAVRDLFHKDLVQAVRKQKRLCIEAVPGLVIIYNLRQRKKPAELKQFFGEAIELFNLMANR